jgi:hypothetical protein
VAETKIQKVKFSGLASSFVQAPPNLNPKDGIHTNALLVIPYHAASLVSSFYLSHYQTVIYSIQ